jgi:hypothetical protein
MRQFGARLSCTTLAIQVTTTRTAGWFCCHCCWVYLSVFQPRVAVSSTVRSLLNGMKCHGSVIGHTTAVMASRREDYLRDSR